MNKSSILKLMLGALVLTGCSGEEKKMTARKPKRKSLW